MSLEFCKDQIEEENYIALYQLFLDETTLTF